MIRRCPPFKDVHEQDSFEYEFVLKFLLESMGTNEKVKSTLKNINEEAFENACKDVF